MKNNKISNLYKNIILIILLFIILAYIIYSYQNKENYYNQYTLENYQNSFHPARKSINDQFKINIYIPDITPKDELNYLENFMRKNNLRKILKDYYYCINKSSHDLCIKPMYNNNILNVIFGAIDIANAKDIYKKKDILKAIDFAVTNIENLLNQKNNYYVKKKNNNKPFYPKYSPIESTISDTIYHIKNPINENFQARGITLTCGKTGCIAGGYCERTAEGQSDYCCDLKDNYCENCPDSGPAQAGCTIV